MFVHKGVELSDSLEEYLRHYFQFYLDGPGENFENFEAFMEEAFPTADDTQALKLQFEGFKETRVMSSAQRPWIDVWLQVSHYEKGIESLELRVQELLKTLGRM